MEYKIMVIPGYPVDEFSGILYIYKGNEVVEQNLIMQVFRDKRGNTEIFAAEELRKPEFMNKIQEFADENKADTLEVFKDKLLTCVFAPKKQPTKPQEPVFTDMEHRILLAALAREEQICKRVDEEGADSDISLLAVVKSIERKVYNLQHPKRGGIS